MAHTNAGQTGQPAGLGNFFGDLVGGAGSIFDATQQQGRINDVNDRANFQDQTFNIGGISGNISGTQSNAQFGGPQQQLQNLLQGQGGSLFAGQTPFGQGDFQHVLGGLNFGGALNQAQGALGQQAGSSAFGGLGGLFGGALQGAGQSFQSGFANQQAAGNQQGLFDQSLASQRAAAQPFQDRLQNRLESRQFAQGRLGSTGGAQQQEALFNAFGQQDLGFQNNAFGQSLAQGQFLGNLGSQQIGQGQGFLGQAGGFEGQQFGQNLQSLGFNSQQGLGQLGALQGLLGQGSNMFNQGAATGLAGIQTGQAGQQQLQDLILGLRNAESDRIQGAGASSAALLQQNAGGAGSGLGSLFGGIGGALGGPLGGIAGNFLGGLFG